MASLVAHPEHGVAVRKLYDPRGISSPEMIKRKEEAGRALGDNPHVAKFLGSAPTPHRGGTMHFNEYVPSTKGAPQAREWAQQTGKDARTALENVGYQGHDIRKGNMVMDDRTGHHKVIDYIPARKGEMFSHPDRPQHIMPTPEGASLFNLGARNPTTDKGLLGGMLGGKAMGVRRNVGVPGTGTLIQGGVGNSPRRLGHATPPRPQPTQVGHASGAPLPSASASTNVLGIRPQTPPAPQASTSVMPVPPKPSTTQATQVASPNALKTPKPVKAIAPIGQ